MDEIRGLKAMVKGIETSCKSLSKRLNDLTSSSRYNAELCDCVSSYKGVQTQIENYIRQVNVMENKLAENEKRDIERDKKLEKVIQDTIYMLGRQDVMQNQIGRVLRGSAANQQQSSDAEFKPLEGQQGRQSTKEINNLTPNAKRNALKSRTQHRPHESSQRLKQASLSYERDGNTTYSDDEENDSNEGVELHHGDGIGKDKRSDKETACNEQHNHSNLEKQISKIDPIARQQRGLSQKENKTERLSERKKIVKRPNITPLRNEAERLQSESSALVPTTRTRFLANQNVRGESELEIVQQPNKECYLTKTVWEVEANAELSEAKKTSLSELVGAKTILLLDTSSSMAAGGAWQQAHTFVNDYLAGLELIESKVCNMEHVALVTYGAQTRCQHRYTNDLRLLKSAFEKVHLGGPSPLYGGVLMTHAIALTPEDDTFQLENGMSVNTKIILITDGEPTETCLHSGPDVPDPKQDETTKTSVFAVFDALRKRSFDIFCVPVGEANMEFLNVAVAKDGGRRILDYRDGHYFSRRLFLSMKLRPGLFFLVGYNFTFSRDDPDIKARDYAHLHEILEDDKIKTFEASRKSENNPYEESGNKRLLVVGSRVRRGPDWDSGDQDGDGPGTVVGHHLHSDLLWVHWDVNNNIRQYHYGLLDKYSVFPVDEPRIPLPGQPLDVGCVVCPGKDWKSDVAPPGSKGVVYRMTIVGDGIRKAVVRWDNGERAIHSYGDDRSYEIQLCLPDTNGSQSSQSIAAIESSSQRPSLQLNYSTPAIAGPTIRTRKPEIQGRTLRANKNKNLQ